MPGTERARSAEELHQVMGRKKAAEDRGFVVYGKNVVGDTGLEPMTSSV